MKPIPEQPHTHTGQSWNTAAYAANGRFVANLATEAVRLLAPQPHERILDIGCGDAALTEQLAAAGARLTGIDASAAMVAAARGRAAASPYPFQIAHHSAQCLPYQAEFEAAFSNAALHWIPAEAQPFALGSIHRALVPSGRFVAEMGGHGNIAAIRTALQAVLAVYGIDAEATAASFFPSPSQYAQLLGRAGFQVQAISLHPRPTPLPGGAEGMAIWLNTFRNGVLDRLVPSDRAQALARTVTLLQPILQEPNGDWIADYVRLRFHAIRQERHHRLE